MISSEVILQKFDTKNYQFCEQNPQNRKRFAQESETNQ